MFYSGIADEAAQDIEGQIQAHVELGWKHIELRNVESTNLTDLSDEEFDRVAKQVETAGLQVSCFASQIANWSRPIDTDLEVDVSELRRAVPRMQRLGTKFIRCMSYPNSKPPLEDQQWRRSVIERMKALVRIAEEGDVILVHENCDGWAGQGPSQSMELLREVGSPHLKLVFDTGNPVAHGQDTWEYYTGVRQEIAYVHIKDYRVEAGGKNADTEHPEVACFPGEGAGHVRAIVRDLLSTGFDGGFSIEPHITSVIHLQQEASNPRLAFDTYVEYGKKLEALFQEVQKGS